MKQRFQELLRSTGREGIESLLTWLTTTDFYAAPASRENHLCKAGGLLQHSLNVYEALEKIAAEARMPLEMTTSIAIVSLLHDLAKIGVYEPTQKWIGKDEKGKWLPPVDTWKADYTKLPLPHGIKSYFLASRHIVLSEDEALAITWHMGAWHAGVTTDFETARTYSEAMKRPLVACLHLADMEATHIMEASPAR